MTELQISDFDDLAHSHLSASHAVNHAIDLLKSALSAKRFYIRTTHRIYWEMRRDMPYVISDTHIPDTQIPINRYFKPVGCTTHTNFINWVYYEDYENLYMKLTKEQIESVVYPIYSRALFNDGNPPWSNRANALDYLDLLLTLQKFI